MTFRSPLVTALAALLLAGCGTYKKDVQTMCDAPDRASIPPGSDVFAKNIAMAEWVDTHLSTSEGKRTFTALAAVEPHKKAELLRAEATKNGIGSCALADYYDNEAPNLVPK